MPRLVDRRDGGRRDRGDRGDREHLQVSLLLGGDDEDAGPLGWIGLLATIIVAPLAASLLQLAVSRQREYLADATGAQFLGRAAPLADTLETLERGSQALPVTVNPATASLYAINPWHDRVWRRSSRRIRRSASAYAGCGRSMIRPSASPNRVVA